MLHRCDKMLRKIKSAYKLQAQIILSAGVIGILMFLFQLYTYMKYRNADFDKMLSVKTQEFFFIFYFSIIVLAFFIINFKFFMAVGVSRKSIFISNVLMYLSVAPIIAIPNLIIYKAFHNYSRFESMYLSLFNKRYETGNIGEKTVLLEYFFWQITTFLVVALFMYAVLILLNRLSKKGIIIFFSLCALIPIAISITIGVVYQGANYPFITHILNTVKYLAGDGRYPIRACVTNIVLAILFGTISYLFIRRSAVK